MTNAVREQATPRITEHLHRYWDQVRVARDFPFEADINPDDIAGIWPSCFLINVADKRFRYDYLGADLIEAYGSDVSKQEICEAIIYPDSPTLFNAMQQALRERRAVEDEGEFINQAGATIRYRCVVMPLARAGETVPGFILGGMRWKWYSRYEATAN